jgi:hypothetical protein
VIFLAVLAAVAGVLLAGALRRQGGEASGDQTGSASMSAARARALLGVELGAGRPEIEAAWRRRMRLAHPDAGGAQDLAAELNAAREKLLR